MDALQKVRVLGLGNVLMGDDALGPWVIEELLANWRFPAGVTVLDVGTPGLDLTPYLAHADTVILVDTVKSDGPAGTIKVYAKDQLLTRPLKARVSPHDPGLAEALWTLQFEGSAPREVTLVGVVPAEVTKGIGLSPGVQEAVRRAAREVIDRLALLRLFPRRMETAAPTSPWWESPRETRPATTPKTAAAHA